MPAFYMTIARKRLIILADTVYCVRIVQHQHGCFNEPRVYLKYISNAAAAKVLMALSGCADS